MLFFILKVSLIVNKRVSEQSTGGARTKQLLYFLLKRSSVPAFASTLYFYSQTKATEEAIFQQTSCTLLETSAVHVLVKVNFGFPVKISLRYLVKQPIVLGINWGFVLDRNPFSLPGYSTFSSEKAVKKVTKMGKRNPCFPLLQVVS